MKEKVSTLQDLHHEGTVLALPCHKLVEHPLRLAYYNQTHLDSLMASIKVSGLLEPILVQPLEDGHYQILNGHYRVQAVRRLRHKTILGHSYPCDQRRALIIFCTSNLLTKRLNALEEAMMMQGLVKEAGFSLIEVGELWGHSKSWVSRRLKLLTSLDTYVKRELDEGHLRPRLAQELARLPQGNDQTRVLALVKRFYLTKRFDLKQIVMGLVTIGRGMPLLGNVNDGNLDDKTWNGQLVDTMAEALNPEQIRQLVYVADSAFFIEMNVKKAHGKSCVSFHWSLKITNCAKSVSNRCYRTSR